MKDEKILVKCSQCSFTDSTPRDLLGLQRACPMCLARLVFDGVVPTAGAKDAPQASPVPHDPVNNPSHYTCHPSGVECIQITEHMDFCLGNAIKYIWRAGLKQGDGIQDLEKAARYLRREIQRRKGELMPEGGRCANP